jgi:hypothetical protein
MYIKPDGRGDCVNLFRRQPADSWHPDGRWFLSWGAFNGLVMRADLYESAQEIVVLYKSTWLRSLDEYPRREIEERRIKLVHDGFFPEFLKADV